MKLMIVICFSLYPNIILCAQSNSDLTPANFVELYYEAYSGTPTSERLSPFYHDDIILDDPTYDWVCPHQRHRSPGL